MRMTEVARYLFIAADETDMSQAVAMGDDNGVYVNIICYNRSGSNPLTVTLQQSTDLENWNDVADSAGGTADASVTAVGHFRIEDAYTLRVAAPYVRLKYVGSATSTFVIAAQIHTTKL